MKFTYIPVASPLHPAQELKAILHDHEQALAHLGGVRLTATPPTPEASCLFYFIQTGGVENEVMRRYHSQEQQGGNSPVLLIAHPTQNSLPASLEILAQVRQEGGSGRIYLLHGAEDIATLAEIEQTVRCAEANRRLTQDRIGRIGESSDWLVASSHRSEVVFNRFRTKILDLPLDELYAHIARDSAPQEGPEWEIWEASLNPKEVTREEFAKVIGVYRGLREMIRIHRLSAVTVRCFDLLRKEGTTGCLAMALLADEGISAGCEGDIPSILLLRWLWHLTGRSAWMANPSDIQPDTGEILLAHCTVPLSLLSAYQFKTHFESGKGVGVAGDLTPSPMTLLRLGGANLDQYWCAEGEWIQAEHLNHLCRTQVRLRISPQSAKQLLTHPLGNHLIAIPGHIRSSFEEAFALFK